MAYGFKLIITDITCWGQLNSPIGENGLNWNTIMVAFPKKHVYFGQGLKLPYLITPKALFIGVGSTSSKISIIRIKLPSRAGNPR